MDVAWASFWEKAGAGNLVLFRVKWFGLAMKGTSCVWRVWAGFGQGWELEWLHHVCESDLSADFSNFGAGDFSFKTLLKSASKSCFFPWASRSGFGAAISSAMARSSVVFCNSASADRIVMAASRLLGATAACVILLSFAAGHRKL